MTTYLESLRAGLARLLDGDARVYLLGEDIVDPYGGAFKVTQGLSTRFPERVIATPISEAGITGFATGLALRGYRPVLEIMFGDFLTLCADQIVNHMCKFPGMYPGVAVPLVIRTPMGAGRGYGATHSQSLEKLFLGTPGLSIVAPSLVHDPGAILEHLVRHRQQPTLFIEHKLLYGMTLIDGDTGQDLSVKSFTEIPGCPTMVLRNLPALRPDVTVIAYGGVSRPLGAVMRRFAEEEISVKAIFPASLQPLPLNTLIAEAREGGRLLIIEEGTEHFNWGSEVASLLYEHLLGSLRHPIKRLSSLATVIPCAAEREEQVIITERKIEDTILELLG